MWKQTSPKVKGIIVKFDLADLRVFLSAADSGSLTAAAAEHNVVVAAVSARLRKMEQAMDLQLFERTGRGIVPTAAGEVLVRQARKVVQEAIRTEQVLEEFAEGRNGRVRLLSNTNMLAEHLPAALGSFLVVNPDISVTVKDKPSFEVVSMLRSGQADIGIVASPADMRGMEQVRFVPDELVLVVAEDFGEEGSFDLRRIVDLEFIALQENVALSQFLRRQSTELGRRFNIRMRADGFEGLCRIVESGAGVGIVPASAAARYSGYMRIRSHPIDEPWSKRELYLCARAEANRAGFTTKLFEHLTAYARNFVANPRPRDVQSA